MKTVLIHQRPDGTTEHTRTRSQCAHLGSARRDCGTCQLFVCRRHPGDSCSIAGPVIGDLRSCATCEDWTPAEPIAPMRGKTFADRPWEGGWKRKPWDFRVTVAIPVLDSAESCAAIVDLLRLQTERPFIMLIDTGSTPEHLAALQELRTEDVEVHSIAFNGVKHPSDFPAVAMDLAFSACRTEHLLATHADCFLMSRTVVAELLELCMEQTPVVGYEITERSHSDWRGMVGHTLTMFHIPTMDRINAGWSMRRLINQYSHPDGNETRHEISPATAPNWPDTELLINYQCRAAGIVPLIIGTERNAARTQDHRIDHCRSWASARLYSAGSAYANDSDGWLQDGITQAKARAEEWRGKTKSDLAASQRCEEI